MGTFYPIRGRLDFGGVLTYGRFDIPTEGI